ncbi:ankyrin repeat domain-containing protein [Legionella worsleiensis]|nr:ankyrin repeat domain-containing protein [Legionella worsleiensis]
MKRLLDAVRSGTLDDVKACIDKGADIDCTDLSGNTPLMLAVLRQHVVIVRYLLTKKPELFKGNNNQEIPISAAIGKDERIIRMLVTQHARVEHLAEINRTDSKEIIINKLITTLLYKSKRNGWDDQHCINLRYYITALDSSFEDMNEKQYESYIRTQETKHRDFFGSWLSDDSDSEEEREFLAQPAKDREDALSEARTYQEHAQRKSLFYRKKNKNKQRGDLKHISEASRVFELGERMQVHHPRSVDMDDVRRDLDRLNELIKAGASIKEAQKAVVTQFRVAQYRGITYLTSKWNKPAREGHRKADELGQPQYSTSVYKAARIDIFRDYARGRRSLDDPDTLKRVTRIANTLRELLLTFREPRPITWKGYSYSTYAYFLQNLYTQAYDKFHLFISQDPMLSEMLINDANPFLSTGAVPHHADKYAYGAKPYKGHKDERLRPRWNKSGRAERPYSGAVYVSLHPLTDFDVDGPLHIPTLTWDAEIRLSNELNIIPEKESCFPSFLQEGRVVHKHIAKYPSFSGPYKQIYLAKYGIDEALYTSLQQMLEDAAPHTDEMVAFKQTLGEWLCGFHEVRLIEIARKKAEEEDCVLIYQGIGKSFTLTPPTDSPHCNTSANTDAVKAPIKQRERFRKLIARGTGEKISRLTNPRDYNQLFKKLDPALLDSHGLSSVHEDHNEMLSLPMAFALNALKHKRYFALDYMLRNPYFSKCLNSPYHSVNTDRLLGASLVHLALENRDEKAMRLFMRYDTLRFWMCNQSVIHRFATEKTYEKISPLALAIINNQLSMVGLMLASKRFNLKEKVSCVSERTFVAAQDDNFVALCSDDSEYEDVAEESSCLELETISKTSKASLVQLAIEYANPIVVVMLLIAKAPDAVKGRHQEQELKKARQTQLMLFFSRLPKNEESLFTDSQCFRELGLRN